MGSRRERLMRLIRMEEDEDDEMFLVVLPYLLTLVNREKRPIHTSILAGAKRVDKVNTINNVASTILKDGLLRDANVECAANHCEPNQYEPVLATSSGNKAEISSGNKEKRGKKRKQSGDYSGLWKEQVKEVTKDVIETKHEDEFSIKRCITLLDSIEELSDEEKAKCYHIFKDPLNREIFLSAIPSTRLIWLRSEVTP